MLDPLEVIDEYGADALRFALLTARTPGSDQSCPRPVEDGRNFANKLWNAARFVIVRGRNRRPIPRASLACRSAGSPRAWPMPRRVPPASWTSSTSPPTPAACTTSRGATTATGPGDGKARAAP